MLAGCQPSSRLTEIYFTYVTISRSRSRRPRSHSVRAPLTMIVTMLKLSAFKQSFRTRRLSKVRHLHLRGGRNTRILPGVLTAWALAGVGIAGAGCSSDSGTAGGQPATSTSATPATSTTGSPVTAVPGSVAPGTKQLATGPSGQTVTISATRATQEGPVFGGPKDSWALGIQIYNTGTAPFTFMSSSQSVLIDSAGGRLAPAPTKSSPAGTPTVVAAGQNSGVIEVFIVPAGATPASIQVTPFSPSGPTLLWNAVPRTT